MNDNLWMQGLVQLDRGGEFQLLVDSEVTEMMDYDCRWEGRMHVEMEEVMKDDDCHHWEDRTQMQLLVEMVEAMMDDDECHWEDLTRMQLLVEMAEVMIDDDCRWELEGRVQLQVVHLDKEYFEAHPDPSPS